MAIRRGRCIAGATIVLAICAYAARPMHVYMMKGQGAISILGDDQYRRALGSIFQGHELKIDLTSDKSQVIENIFNNDIVYLSLHASPELMKVANGDKLNVADLVTAYTQTYHQKGPSLVIVSGCETLKDVDARAMNFPAAFGIKDGTTNRAYLGFKRPVNGSSSDRFFRVFLGIWMRSPYPTLVQARDQAKVMVAKLTSQQTEKDAQIVTFFKFDVDIADQLSIVGNSNLRLSDIN
jgi:hypothetical protein